ncbi:MAG: nuclear transport factor 2 family protein [Acidimicrobiaceae bacterium]|nr:nuclear transport factor 2 family protein [Acidimicrobiaceae bacterium]MBO0748392.1 nuclear transport factor 2 family protein [Acidimicrobiaceae bacterium]
MSVSPRVRAAEAYVQAFRTGEGSPARRAAEHLAPDVVLTTNSGELKGRDEVLAHISGNWPQTPVLQQGGFSFPAPDGDDLVVDGYFPALGAAVRSAKLRFSFDGDDRITKVVEQLEMAGRPTESKTITLPVKAAINGALGNGTPMVVAYTADDGTPSLSLRGSTVVYSDTQLAIWLRNGEGGLPKAIAQRPGVSLLYRDSRTRTTLIVKGNAHVESDQAVRDRVYELTPEVEQFHDTQRKGAALIIDVTEIRGTSPGGAVLIKP